MRCPQAGIRKKMADIFFNPITNIIKILKKTGEFMTKFTRIIERTSDGVDQWKVDLLRVENRLTSLVFILFQAEKSVKVENLPPEAGASYYFVS